MSTPNIGIHPGVAMPVYHGWEGVSNSRLSVLRRSPAHLRAYLEEPPPDTEALAFGRAAHYAILEPDKFAERYRRGPEGDRRTREVREEWEALQAEVGTAYVLRPVDYDACIGMRDSVHSLRKASGMLTGDGDVELSCVWGDEATGLLCKGRMDRHSPELAGGAVVDLKTTRDASRREFERSIFKFGYHRQAAFYLQGARVLGLPARHYSIIAVEKVRPFAAAVYRITEPAIEAGAEQIRPLMDLYARCVEADQWPAYPDEVVDIALPDWAWRVAADETMELST